MAFLFRIILYPIAYIYGLFKTKDLNKWNLELAISIDQHGNSICKYLFNDLFIKSNGYQFGNIDETVSSAIGKNKLNNTLTILGELLNFTLNILDNNHTIKSIDKNVNIN